ncbi:MAG: cation acetate symporter [Hamadaea sp.]|nr:cation acetate symporter [Hamadaea sp.]
MDNAFVLPALGAVALATLGIGAYGLRLSRTTSDFLVASRMISPRWNAAAISGEYLSAASFLGVAGLILRYGVDMLWYPVGFAAGYLALLLFVAGPLRRSGAFTLPDYCQLRLGSRRLRKLATGFVVFIGWLYLVPQFQGAGLTLATVTGSPYWMGSVLVAAVVTANVAFGGMRAITFVQAFQYWLKLTALAVPAIFLVLHWRAAGQPAVPAPLEWLLPSEGGQRGLFATYSLMLATFLGTMGLPHVLVRFYTNPDGAAARRTTLVVLGLVGTFYLFPTLYGVLGRIWTPELARGGSDAVVLLLPERALGSGLLGQMLGALVAAGAFAAFLSTASGLLTAVAGVLATDVFGSGSVRAFRFATVVGGAVPLVLALHVTGLNVSQVVGLAFAVAASSFCPLLVLGTWWRGLTDFGAAAGILVGGGAAAASVLVTVFGPGLSPTVSDLVAQPAAWTVPLAFAVMVIVSLATQHRIPADIRQIMFRLHAPEALRSPAL